MLQGWRIGLEVVVREEARPVAMRLEVTADALLEFVEATLHWGDIGMRVSASAHREGEMRELEGLAAEQGALRRVAELVAAMASPEEVFAVVTNAFGDLLEVNTVRTLRFEPDGSATVLAAQGRPGDRMPPGTNLPIAPGGMLDQVLRTGNAARFEDYAPIGGTTSAILREEGLRCAAGGPIVVDGRLWGAMVAAASGTEALPPGSEDRIAKFAEQVSTAISNVESRARVERLAAEQAALRRVAELVARQAPADELFALVTEELSHLLGVDLTVRTVRYNPDGTATILAEHGVPETLIAADANTPRLAGGVLDQVLRADHPEPIGEYAPA